MFCCFLNVRLSHNYLLIYFVKKLAKPTLFSSTELQNNVYVLRERIGSSDISHKTWLYQTRSLFAASLRVSDSNFERLTDDISSVQRVHATRWVRSLDAVPTPCAVRLPPMHTCSSAGYPSHPGDRWLYFRRGKTRFFVLTYLRYSAASDSNGS